MNYKPLVVILMFGIFHTKAQQKSDISFKEIESEFCRNCYGSLVVVKGNVSDTINGGQWGQPVNYELVKIKDKEYLYTNYLYGHPGGTAVMVYSIHSLDQDNFLVPLFEKSIDVYRETHRDYNNIAVNFIFERNVDIKFKNGIEFEIGLKISYCPEIEDEKCETLFEESHIDFYKIN